MLTTATDLIATGLAIDPGLVDWHARKLDQAGLWGRAANSPLNLARLLTGLMVAERPGDAERAVRVYEALPLATIVQSDWEKDSTGAITQRVNQRTTNPNGFRGQGAAMFSIMAPSFVHGLATLIEEADPTAEISLDYEAWRIEVTRSLKSPEASMVYFTDRSRVEFLYLKSLNDYAQDVGRLIVKASAPGRIIRALGELVSTPRLASASHGAA